MDQTAIKRIEELAVSAMATSLINEGADMKTPAVAVPAGVEVKSLEHLLEAPVHQRATYTTERLEDFCNYVSEEHLTESNSAVFVLPDGSGAEGIIDYGTHNDPLWGHHRAKLTMKYTPEFAALLAACARDLSQRDLIDFIEDWQHVLTPFDGETATSVATALQKIQRIDIKASATQTNTVGDMKHQRTAFEEIEAKSADGAPPSAFAMTCQVYPCTRSRDVRARLSLKTGGDKPTFRLRIIGEDALRKEVAEEIDFEIRGRLGKDVRTFVGSVKKG